MTMDKTPGKTGRLLLALLFCVLATASAQAETESCYSRVEHPPEDLSSKHSFYIFIDQTMSLTSAMKDDIKSIVHDQADAGTRIRIARLSANTRGQYAELMFDDYIDVEPSDYLAFNLRRKDRRSLNACLETRGKEVRERMMKTLARTLDMNSNKLPRTELLNTLKRFSQDMLTQDSVANKSVLVVTDGLENSPVFTFHSGKSIKLIETQKSMEIVRKHDLIGDWSNVKVYVYGLGHLADKSVYVTPKLLAELQNFWEMYFTTGGGNVVDIGLPALLRTSLRDDR